MQVDNPKDLDVVIAMYDLLEYSNNYLKTSGILWQYYKEEPDGNIRDFKSFKFK